ncbi:energy-coupling factor transporter ATPase [Candidatus Nitronereus thalassa]|uniref:Energy-coupling factor transporter ATPase n=1 Tax=Candidatus Nitronereus thalassa TaxID=3020898 RepID=A0ABU3K7E3_9BACT|nr:energy-coupling factor transporter ATPase [Candidatus Nitronereus thalassa]MDT7042248.1 energy-coupling factor transporter ATPase [Candidatus Nitronereus thalassa]
MNLPSLSPWSPRRWYRELRHVWEDTRLLVLTAQIAAIYAAVLIPFKVGIPIIPGFVELRPANVIPIVSSLLFGPAAAWGSGIGNIIGDCFGTLGPASLFGFLGNFLYGFVPYVLWGNLGWLSSGREPVVRSWRQGLEYLIIGILASMVCAVTIGWGVELLGLLPFWLLTPAIFFNNLVMGLLLGPPLLLFLYPRVKQWNLFYRDFDRGTLVGSGSGAQSKTETIREPASIGLHPEALAVSIQDLTFHPTHAPRPVLSKLSLAVKRGELVVVMGRTGSGKSTLCYALNGLVPQFVQGDFQGTVTVMGHQTTHTPVWEQANRVGMVFQDFETQLVSTNVETELRYALESQNGPRNGWNKAALHQRIHDTLKLVGLSGLARRNPFCLSGGQRQRLVVASVLVREPQVLVMDQPLTDLDPEGRRVFIQLLAQLKAKGVTVILAEHCIEDLIAADRVVVLDQGEVRWQGTPRDLLSHPELAIQHGVSLFPLAKCFQDIGVPTLPATVEEAWHIAENLGLQLKSLESHESGASLASPLSSSNIIEVQQVSVEYQPGVLALSQVSLSVQAGEFVAIIGQNGSGKSTLAKLFNGLLVPSQGRVLVQGQDTAEAGVGRLASIVGHVFQNPDHQIFAETVRKEIAFGARNAGCPSEECDQRVEDTLQAVGLTGAEGLDPFSLTKGERQRVAVASILATKPQVIIVDEPTTGLDAEESVRMMTMIRSLNQQGHTIIMITHDMELVAKYAKRCVLLGHGAVLGDGPTRNIFSNQELMCAATLEWPALTRFSQRWGSTLLTVDEVTKALRT